MSKQDTSAPKKRAAKKAGAAQDKPKQAASKPSARKRAGNGQPATGGKKNDGPRGGGQKTTSPKSRKAASKAEKPATRETTGMPPRSDDAAAQPRQPAATATLISVPMMVRWRDLDAFNHVNNSKFLSYLEEARLQWLMTLPGEWIDENIAPVVAAAHINYLRPIAWPNEIAIELFIERLGNTSLTIGHRIVGSTEDGALYADGNVVMVWIDKQGGKAAALPEVIRTACRGA